MDKPSKLDEALRAIEPLDADDRLRLIARIWSSLPDDYWAAPGDRDRAELGVMLQHDDTARMADLPRRIAWRVGGMPLLREKVYSAPRRFDLATIFVVTAAYSIGLGSLRGLGAPAMVTSYIAGFITFVGIGQALLFGGNKPRIASVLTGVAAWFLLTMAMPLVGEFDIGSRFEQVAFALMFSGPVGGVAGYAAGALVGGVFLVADKLRNFVQQRQQPGDDVVPPSGEVT